MRRILVGTHNKGKLAEFVSLLAPLAYEVVSAGDLGLAEPEETGTTFAENAKLKAVAAAKASGLPALADDSGLCVTALNNGPGLYSSRFAGSDYEAAFTKIISACVDEGEWRARFVCALCYAQPSGEAATYIGQADGMIAKTPALGGGFGYDPIFIPLGYGATYAELGAHVKDEISHRAQAFAQLVSVLVG